MKMKVGYVIVSDIGDNYDILWHTKDENGQVVPEMFDKFEDADQARYEDGNDESDFVGILVWVKDILTILNLDFKRIEEIQYQNWLKDKI